MIIYHQKNIAAFVGAHIHFNSLQIIMTQRISVTTAAPVGRIMGALAGHGGLAGPGGIAGKRGGIAG